VTSSQNWLSKRGDWQPVRSWSTCEVTGCPA